MYSVVWRLCVCEWVLVCSVCVSGCSCVCSMGTCACIYIVPCEEHSVEKWVNVCGLSLDLDGV